MWLADSLTFSFGFDRAVYSLKFAVVTVFLEQAMGIGTGEDYVGDLRLGSSSSALNVGNNADLSLPATDLDGNPRIVNGTVDMGAYERQ